MNRTTRQRRSALVLVFILGAVLVIVVIAIGLGSGGGTGSPLQTGSNPLSPPLENVDFPLQPIPYPADWPDELKFPNELSLVDSSSGTLPESTTQGWSAKFRYQGKPPEAVQVISAFLEEKGWATTENHQFDSGGFVLQIQKGQGDGIVILDSDPTNNSQTLILATIFP